MRTTLDISDDVLFAAKDIARREKKSVGEVISDLARRSFGQADLSISATAARLAPQVSERLASYGIEPLPSRGGIVSNALIDRLRDEEGV